MQAEQKKEDKKIMSDEKIRKILREELGPLYDMSDTVIYLEEEKEDPFIYHCSRITQAMVETWEIALKESGNSIGVTRLYIDALIDTFIHISKKSIEKEDLNKLFKNAFDRMMESLDEI